ncbi:MAG: S8 family serine peptidase, partial [Granulicella sp.]
MAQEPLSVTNRRSEIKDTLQTRLISEPLKSKIDADLSQPEGAVGSAAVPAAPALYEVIIELNLNSPSGRTDARNTVLAMLHEILGPNGLDAIARNRSDSSHPYVFATLSAIQIFQLASLDREKAVLNGETSPAANPTAAVEKEQLPRSLRSIFRIWESQKVHPLTTESIRTIKANAAHNSFGATGEKIVWAVLDSGVDATHPHFALHANLKLEAPLTDRSCSFTSTPLPWDQDAFGHGTHVAAIIAGQSDAASVPQAAIQGSAESGDSSYHLEPVPGIKGMAPCTKLLILRVLDDNGDGDETALI